MSDEKTLPKIVSITPKQHEPFILELVLDDETTVEVPNQGDLSPFKVGDEYVAPEVAE